MHNLPWTHYMRGFIPTLDYLKKKEKKNEIFVDSILPAPWRRPHASAFKVPDKMGVTAERLSQTQGRRTIMMFMKSKSTK